MSRTSLQYQLPKKGGAFATVPVPLPHPDRNEVCVRVKAIALNPVDWKRQLSGFMVETWPVVLGLDAAGTIEGIGDGVDGLQVGDEVFCLANRTNRGGAFQEVMATQSFLVGKKPSFLTFEEAASLPLCFITAAAYIVMGLHVSLPFVEAPDRTSLKSILVLGGSSAVGSAAIQLLRMALPTATILTTSSAKHHAHLVTLGATRCFERSVKARDPEFVASTLEGLGVDAILDTVGAAADEPSVFEFLNPKGPRLYSQVLTGKNVEVPDNVDAPAVQARDLFALPGGRNALSALADLLRNKQYKLPVKVEVVGHGLDSIQEGLNVLKNGVSGTKCVVSLQDVGVQAQV